MDEVELFNRALSQTEIQSIVDAGSAGKCRPSPTPTPTASPTPTATSVCVPPPPNMVSWWPGDGNANDISGNNNNGSLQGGATFAAGKVDQAFSFNGSDAFVLVPDSVSLNPAEQITIDAWVYPTADAGGTDVVAEIADKETSPGSVQYEIGRRNGNTCPGGEVFPLVTWPIF